MIVIGIVLLLAGMFFHSGILWALGVVLAIAGAAAALLGRAGRRVGPRVHYNRPHGTPSAR